MIILPDSSVLVSSDKGVRLIAPSFPGWQVVNDFKETIQEGDVFVSPYYNTVGYFPNPDRGDIPRKEEIGKALFTLKFLNNDEHIWCVYRKVPLNKWVQINDMGDKVREGDLFLSKDETRTPEEVDKICANQDGKWDRLSGPIPKGNNAIGNQFVMWNHSYKFYRKAASKDTAPFRLPGNPHHATPLPLP